MRSGRTYRSDRKRRARDQGLTLAQLDEKERLAKEYFARKTHELAMSLSPEQARMALGIWAQSGGKINVLTGEK